MYVTLFEGKFGSLTSIRLDSSMGSLTATQDMIQIVLRHEANLFVKEEMECFLRYTSLSC